MIAAVVCHRCHTLERRTIPTHPGTELHCRCGTRLTSPPCIDELRHLPAGWARIDHDGTEQLAWIYDEHGNQLGPPAHLTPGVLLELDARRTCPDELAARLAAQLHRTAAYHRTRAHAARRDGWNAEADDRPHLAQCHQRTAHHHSARTIAARDLAARLNPKENR